MTFAQAMPNHVWSATPDGALDWFNDQVFSYAGLRFDDLAGSKWAHIVHPMISKQRQRLGRRRFQHQPRMRSSSGCGVFRWHLGRALPIKIILATTVRWISTNTDVDKQKAAEAHQKLLAGELEHRIKNTMAMVSTITKPDVSDRLHNG